jgi:small subunit ribosomal protein S6
MAFYESVFIARQDLGATQVATLAKDLSEVVANNGGEVVRVDNWGLKNLAYRIKKNRKGYYVILNLNAESKAVNELERVMRFNEDIIRYLTVKVEAISEEAAYNSSSVAEDVEK